MALGLDGDLTVDPRRHDGNAAGDGGDKLPFENEYRTDKGVLSIVCQGTELGERMVAPTNEGGTLCSSDISESGSV